MCKVKEEVITLEVERIVMNSEKKGNTFEHLILAIAEGDREFALTLKYLMIESLKELDTALWESLEKGDRSILSTSLHKAKTTFGNLQLIKLGELMNLVIENWRQEEADFQLSEELNLKIEQEMEEVLNTLKNSFTGSHT